MTPTLLILARTVQIGACLLLFGVFAFDRFVAVSIFDGSLAEIEGYWRDRTRLFCWSLLPLIFISGLAWFVLVAMGMSGQPLQPEILKTVWTQTEFGKSWMLRLGFWLVMTASVGTGRLRGPWLWLPFLMSGALLGSLAWAGHGLEGPPWHLFGDVLHLLVAGFWPAGLLPLVLLVRRLQHPASPQRRVQTARLVRRFSGLSLVSVVLLAATGFMNSWCLVGSVSNLFNQPYGRVLLIKLVLFIFAVTIGAVNLLRLKPRLSLEQHADSAAASLQFNVWLEVWIGAVLVLVVAILGILPPGAGK